MPRCDMKTRYIPATFAWTVLLGATTLFFYFPAQYYILRHPWVPAYQGFITFFVLANFTLATFMDPGVIPKAPPDEDREDDFRAPLYKNVDINGITVRMKWCVTCKFYRPPRCSHCSVCNHCIETFDHHCPWVNNCIGRRNYRFFFFFLISLSLHMISIFTLSLVFVLHHKERLSDYAPIVAMVLMGIVVILAIPIFGLTGFHMVLVSRGRTTNEQVTGKFKGGFNPFSRGCWKNCCYTQFGPQFPSLMRPHKYSSKKKHCLHGPIATIANDNQVKTYMDNSNGVRNVNSSAYNKLSPGREGIDPDLEPSASQSADCEATPPLQRHGSKNNFFLPPIDAPPVVTSQPPSSECLTAAMPPTSGVQTLSAPPMGGVQYVAVRHALRGGAAVQQQQQQQTTSHSSCGGTGGAQRPSPTMQQRIKALGVPTPLAMSSPVRRSNPSTPTQPRRPDFIGVVAQQQQHAAGGILSGASAAHHMQQQHRYMPPADYGYYDLQAARCERGTTIQPPPMDGDGGDGHQMDGHMPPYHASPQRRFLSEGELVRQMDVPTMPTQHVTRGNNTVDNIRELANSPQRGVYMWKETSPSGCYGPPPPTSASSAEGLLYTSNPTSPTQQQQQQQQQHYYHHHQQQQQHHHHHHHQGVGAAVQQPPPRTFHPALRGGVSVYPPQSSPQPQQLQRKSHHHQHQQQMHQSIVGGGGTIAPSSIAGGPRRPMSFVRALEMSDAAEAAQQQNNAASAAAQAEQQQRTSVYDMNYEISV